MYYFGINTGFNSVETFPEDSHTREAFGALEADFLLGYGFANPARIVIDGDISDPEVAGALQKFNQSIADDPELVALPPVTHGSLTLISVPVSGPPSGEEAFELINRLRNEYVPAAFSGVPAEAYVGGISADYMDFNEGLTTYLPIIFAFILGVSFVLLLIVFRSIVVPIKAIIMNLLSVGAAYGLMVIVFQKGVGADVFGFQQIEPEQHGCRWCSLPSYSGCRWTTTSSCSAESVSATIRHTTMPSLWHTAFARPQAS